MRLLLDTHIFLWLQTDPAKLGAQLDIVDSADNELLVSAASSWEIGIKYGLGRLPLSEPPTSYVPSRLRAIGATSVPIESAHALAVSDLPPIHRDPFDRMLVAQALALEATLLTADQQLTKYPAETLLVD